MPWLTAVGQNLNCLWVVAFSVLIISSTPELCKIYCVVELLYYIYIYIFLLKKPSGCTGKIQNINKSKTNLCPECVYFKSHQACDRCQAFLMRAEVL